MPDPAVIRQMRQFRRALLNREAQTIRALALRWVELERALDGLIAGVTADALEAYREGMPISAHTLRRLRRYQTLEFQALDQIDNYADDAAKLISNQQRDFARWATQNSVATLEMLEPGISGAFHALPIEAFEHMVGHTATGGTLYNHFVPMYPQAVDGMMSELVRGIGLGHHSTKIARAMNRGLGVAFNQAMTTARTETHRVYREVSLQEYQQSSVVNGYYRLAAKSKRTCIACLLKDGVWFPNSVPFEEHPNGRCVPIPAIQGKARPIWNYGRDWFRDQAPSDQASIVNNGKLMRAWRGGRIALDDMVYLKHNHTWGNSWQVPGLQQALRNAQQRRLGAMGL